MFLKPRTTSSKPLSSREKRMAEYLAAKQNSLAGQAHQSPTAPSQPVRHTPLPETVHTSRPSQPLSPETGHAHVSTISPLSPIPTGSASGGNSQLSIAPRRISWPFSMVPVYAVLILAAGIGCVFTYYYYTIRLVSVRSILNPEQKIAGIEELVGKSMIFTPTSQIEAIVLKHNPQLESVSIQKNLPQTIELDPRYAHTIGYMKVNDHLYVLLNQAGKVIRVVFDPPPDTPDILYYQKLVSTDYDIGVVLPYADIRYACQVGNMFQRYGYTRYHVNIQDTTRIEVTQGTTVYVFSHVGDTQKQLQNFEQMLQYLKRTHDTFTKIDFRFDRVITEK